MTITPALLTASHNSGTSSFTTASATYAVGKWYVAIVLSEGSNAHTFNTPTISGWTMDKHVVDTARDDVSLTVLWFIGDGSTKSLTIDFGGQAQGFVNWQILEVTGTRTSSSPIVQSVTAVGSGATPTATLAAFADPVKNATLQIGTGYFFDLVKGASYTLISNATGDLSLVSGYKVGADTAPSMSTASPEAWAFYAAEIADAAATAPVAAKLGILTKPTDAQTHHSFTITVAVQDAGGATLTGNTDSVTLTPSGTGTATFSGNLTVAAVAGVATFALTPTKNTENASIAFTASSGSLTPAVASAITLKVQSLDVAVS